ncbi:type I pantothenate kinase [Lactobacillus sp. PV037]|uniref:type I pantothenate kinase n=1 Tax=Lactobacillus sp. PV037 TaxID=2594496 RepID=UPI0022400F2D|nr:type I pantothenate kinase [Lactobacillus sp. PV037]QNQ83149.1 type I pantothenate kinase [Lactobacillus sp. PV037]
MEQKKESEWKIIPASEKQPWQDIIDILSIKTTPFIIGVSGAVASGKSTFATKLKQELEKKYPLKKIEVVSADNFLKSNAELEEKGLMEQKGFPVSFNWNALANFFEAVKNHYPNIPYRIYSHELSDLVPNQVEVLEQVDILIIEGIYLLEDAPGETVSPRKYINFNFYLDTSEENLYCWYLERFHKMMDLNYNNPGNFFYSWAHRPRQEADKFAEEVWKKVNLKNLHSYIAPTKKRADVIVKKEKNHQIKEIMIKRKEEK